MHSKKGLTFIVFIVMILVAGIIMTVLYINSSGVEEIDLPNIQIQTAKPVIVR